MSTARPTLVASCGLALCLSVPPAAHAGPIDNLALGKPVFHTTDPPIWVAANLTDGETGNSSSGIWHFGGLYDDVILGANPYFGAVDIAGANNTVSIKTIRLFGTYSDIPGAGQSPRSLTVQSRDSAADPLDATVDSGWTNTGMSFTGVTHANGSFTLANAINTRALRVRITEMNLGNDRLSELEAFSVNPHERSLPHLLGIDPVLSRSDNVPLAVTNITRLRDDNFDLGSRPTGVALSLTDDVMNYDYDFGSAQIISGLRIYTHASMVQVDVQVPDGLGGWITIPGGVQTNPFNGNGNQETYYFGFGNGLTTQQLRLRTLVRDINNDPRSQVQAGEIEIYNFVPEPASLGLLAAGTLALLARRRKPLNS